MFSSDSKWLSSAQCYFLIKVKQAWKNNRKTSIWFDICEESQESWLMITSAFLVLLHHQTTRQVQDFSQISNLHFVEFSHLVVVKVIPPSKKAKYQPSICIKDKFSRMLFMLLSNNIICLMFEGHIYENNFMWCSHINKLVGAQYIANSSDLCK